MDQQSCLRSDPSVQSTDCEVSGSERRPTQGPQSTRIDSDDGRSSPGRFSPWCHRDSAESVPTPATPLGAPNDSTVGFSRCVVMRGARWFRSCRFPEEESTWWRGQGHTNDSVRFAAFANIARNDRLEHESESDTLSVGARHQGGPRQRRRLVLMSSGTVATAIDSPDSHDERFQRVRRAMSQINMVHSASEDHSEASVEGHVDATEPLRTATLRVAFATLDSIVLPDFVEEAPICHEERASLPQGSIPNVLRLALGGSGFEGVHPSRAGLEVMLLLPRMLLHRPPRGGSQR